MSWKQLSRKALINSKFLKIYQDSVELPNGTIINDYTLVEKPSFVMVVATDQDNHLITIDEYKYAINQEIHSLPAGHLENNEDPLERAKKELFEETGYSGGEWENLGQFYDYPTKDLHKVYFFRAKHVTNEHTQQLEDTEKISSRVITIDQLKEEVKKNEWRTNAVLAAFIAAGLLH